MTCAHSGRGSPDGGIAPRLLARRSEDFAIASARLIGVPRIELRSSGTAALENGLVDELGGVEAAIRSAREIAKAPDAKVVTFPKDKTIMELFEHLLGSTSARTST